MLIFSFIGHIMQKLFGKSVNLRQICLQMSSNFYVSHSVYFQNSELRRKNISSLMFDKFSFHHLKNAYLI